MKVTVKGNAAKRCPYRNERDAGTFSLTFDVPEGDAPELHGLAEQIDGLANSATSHENYTRILGVLTEAQHVVTRWTTAGLDVTCEWDRL